MDQHYSFLIDLHGISLDESQTTWMQAFPFGTYEHPLYGTIKMDADKAARMAFNIKSNVRGQDLDIDYDHKERDGIAAGWISDAEVRTNGLYLKVSFTDRAKAHLAAKEYKYFSPEYADEWEDPRNKTKYQDVLLGGALTNRPFLKGILPINLSEMTMPTPPKGDSKVDPKLIRQFLGLAETATDDEVVAKLKEGPPKVDTPANEPKLTEPDPTLVKLAESNPAIKAMLDAQAAQTAQLAEQAKQIGVLAAANRLSEINQSLSDLSTTKYTIAPAAETKLREALIAAPRALSDKIIEAAKELIGGVVELGERGGRPAAEREETNGVSAFLSEVDKMVKASEDKMNVTDAASFVAANDPDLYDDYRKGSYAWETK